MGIHGILKEIGPGTRISLAKLSAAHYRTHARPFRLAIDISIWLFQIQSGKGGSNPALRTFYYRLLRLLSWNIHPLFVFDGPNKPLFKRNKKVGGPGVRVATVPEFLAKQLLKQFGFPWHVAPGEAEAECALLEVEGVVDAVLSDDADTLMFGSRVTVRNWTPEGSTKTPTHVNLYRAEVTKEGCGLDRDGMVLVALMSGGDYIPEGIPGCGPKLACDAARAGFGKDLCALRRSDKDGLKSWRERLQHEIRTNESKLFSRKNRSLIIPDDFPSQEVLGYYTHPCVSSPAKVTQLRSTLKWDQPIDFLALRSFAQDAFDWRCLGGAKKFIRNLAPAMLVRRLRLVSEENVQLSQEAQEEAEAGLATAVHGTRTHYTTDHETELRISFTPSSLVPIDLSLEDEEDDFLPAGGLDISDNEGDDVLPPSTATSDAEDAPQSPTKKIRQARPYDPEQPEKLWILKDFLQLGCPLLLEAYEASQRDPKASFKQKRAARAAAGAGNIHAVAAAGAKKGGVGKGKAKAKGGGQENALTRHLRVGKVADCDVEGEREGGKVGSGREGSVLSDGPVSKATSRPASSQSAKPTTTTTNTDDAPETSAFKLPSTQIPSALLKKYLPSALPSSTQPLPKSTAGFFAPFIAQREQEGQRTPTRRKKRRSADLSTPRRRNGGREATVVEEGRASIREYFSPTPRRDREKGRVGVEVVELFSSSPVPVFGLGGSLDGGVDSDDRAVLPSTEFLDMTATPLTASKVPQHPRGLEKDAFKAVESADDLVQLPATVTKRRRRGPLPRKSLSAPAAELLGTSSPLIVAMQDEHDDEAEVMDLTALSPMVRRTSWDTGRAGGFLRDEEGDVLDCTSSLPTPPADEEREEEHGGLGAGRQRGGNKLGRANEYDDHDHDDDDNDDELPDLPIARPSNRRSPRLSSRARPSSNAISRPVSAVSRATTSSRSKPTIREPAFERANSTTVITTAQPASRKTAKSKFVLRKSLAGAWKEVDVEEVDMTGDSPRTAGLRGRVAKERGGGWRKSGVEVLDLTGV